MAILDNEHLPRRPLKYSVILLVFVLLAFAAFFSWQSWQSEKSAKLGQLATIADLGEKAIDTYFNQLEIGLQSLGMDLVDPHNQLDLARGHTLVNRFLKLHTELSNVALIQPDGRILMTGNTPPGQKLPSLASDSSFIKSRAELQQGIPFSIGPPTISNIDNDWMISARYGIKDPSGNLVYILSANLPINMMQNFWKDSSLSKTLSLGIIHDDGYLVSHYPNPYVVTLDQMFQKPIANGMAGYLRANNFPQRGQIEELSSASPVTVVKVMRRLTHYPATLFVEIPTSEIQAAWWDKVQIPYLLITLMLTGIFMAYHLALRRRRAWSLEKRREENRRIYEQALIERSPNEIYLFDEKTLQFTYVNDFALNNLGYTLEEMQNKTLLSLHPEFTKESFEAMIQPLRRGEQETIKFQTVQTRANGSTYPAEVHLQLISDDDGSGFLAIINDLTALNQAEDNIRKFNAPVERRATLISRMTASGVSPEGAA